MQYIALVINDIDMNYTIIRLHHGNYPKLYAEIVEFAILID